MPNTENRTKSVALNVRMTPEKAKEFKVLLAQNGQSAQFILESAINEYIRMHGGVVSDE